MREVAPRLQILVAGANACDGTLAAIAEEAGAAVARAGAVTLTGGRGGVMAAAARGARGAGGLVIGILPGATAQASPPDEQLDVALFSGLSQARNQVLVLSADAVVAIGGGWGTLSEIALALKFRIPVVTLRSWSLRRPDGLNDPLLAHAVTAPDAVALALRAAERRRAGEPRGEATVE